MTLREIAERVAAHCGTPAWAMYPTQLRAQPHMVRVESASGGTIAMVDTESNTIKFSDKMGGATFPLDDELAANIRDEKLGEEMFKRGLL